METLRHGEASILGGRTQPIVRSDRFTAGGQRATVGWRAVATSGGYRRKRLVMFVHKRLSGEIPDRFATPRALALGGWPALAGAVHVAAAGETCGRLLA